MPLPPASGAKRRTSHSATAPQSAPKAIAKGTRVHTDEGLIGLGETSRGARAVEAQLHDLVAPYLLGKDPLAIAQHSRALLDTYLGFASAGAEVRAASVVDMALWDLFGQAVGQPIYQLLGGASREGVLVYGHASGRDLDALHDSVCERIAEGFRAVRIQAAVPGIRTVYGVSSKPTGRSSVKLKRTIDFADLKPYFHGTASRSGAPFCAGSGLP